MVGEPRPVHDAACDTNNQDLDMPITLSVLAPLSGNLISNQELYYSSILHRSPHLIVPCLCDRLILGRLVRTHTSRNTFYHRVGIGGQKVRDGKSSTGDAVLAFNSIGKRRESDPVAG